MDGSGHSHKSVMLWWNLNLNRCDSDVTTVSGSPQIAELAAVVRAFERWSIPFNLITDSAYVAGLVERTEVAVLKDVPNADLFYWLQQLVFLLDNRQESYFVMHVRSHTTLPGFIAEGNRQADLLMLPAQVVPDRFSQAKNQPLIFSSKCCCTCENFCFVFSPSL